MRITGGETYQSVGIGFDGHELAMNAVYLSASGPKVQFTRQGADARWDYPAAGMAAHPVKLGQDYVLELLVRDQLLNVLVDGQLKIAYELPQRQAGQLSVWAFSATAEFDQLDVTSLPSHTQLAAAGKGSAVPRVMTREDHERAVRVAQAAEQVAVARRIAALSGLESLEARIKAEQVKYGLESGDTQELAQVAGRSSRRHALNLLGQQIARAQLNLAQAQQKQESADNLQTLEKQLTEVQQKFVAAEAELENNSAEYAPLGTQYPQTSSGRCLAFARWITDRNNPLTARVLVNHVWLRHFGTPLVQRTFDFGLRSDKPQHAQLLDWLAISFMEQGWSLKQLHKAIVMSGVYRLRSSAAEASAQTCAADPDNLTYWRTNVRRMEAEAVRDSVLYLGDSLDVTMGGPPIEHTQGEAVLRRSLYFRQDKERQMTFLSLFDEPR